MNIELDLDQLAGVLQSLIFVSGDPVPFKRLCETLELPEEQVREGLQHLNETLEADVSGIQLMEVAGGLQLRTRPVYSAYVNRFLERKRTFTLSGAALETLAIIAYKQPITRAEIEAIRGVGVDGVLKSLLDKRFVKVVGVKEAPGRPNLYGSTKHFLEHFGINSLKDLPPIENIEETFSSHSASEEEALAEDAVATDAKSETPVEQSETAEQPDTDETKDQSDALPARANNPSE